MPETTATVEQMEEARSITNGTSAAFPSVVPWPNGQIDVQWGLSKRELMATIICAVRGPWKAGDAVAEADRLLLALEKPR